MSASDDRDPSGFEALWRQLDGISKQLEDLKGRLEGMARSQERRAVKAFCLSLTGLLLGLLVDPGFLIGLFKE